MACHTVSAQKNIQFKKQVLDTKFRSEGVAVGDFNKDGKMDIAAGYVWYEAPDWEMHTIVEKTPEYQPKGYSNSFCTFVEDLNGDGWHDIIVVDFPGTPTWWFENPKGKKGIWKKHTVIPVTNNESPQMVDVDLDGKLDLLAAFSPDPKKPDGPDRQMAFAIRDKDPAKQWKIFPISKKAAASCRKYSHGLGFGDINKDGRSDIVVPQGWWESPKDPKKTDWVWHPAPFGGEGSNMYVYDFDGDGDNDVFGSSPHRFGIWWFEQTGEDKWKKHEIDNSFSQTHAVCFADINGDGLPDLVTGKRWWAHGGRDPGGDGPSVMCWFELTRRDGKAHFIRHQFDHDSGIGTQFQTVDINGDKLLDIVTSNKKGVFLFTQSRD